MSIKINQLDLFSGIGGFHLGFERAGYEVTSYFSEIDKHAVAVYQHKFKDATYVGSVTDVRGADLPNIDLITFGSPCQDFSLAGKRKGMDGERSSLILEAIRLITECQPRAFVWENVKGTFSSNDGEDFAAILQAFANIGGYRLEWQLLNTSWFLPQNRERIYLVGYSTTPKRDWGGVFPIGETRGANNEPSEKEIGKDITHTICSSYSKFTNDSPVIFDNYNYKWREDGNVGTLTSHSGNLHEGFKIKEIGDYRNDEGWRPRKDGLSPCLATRRHSEVDISNTPPLLKQEVKIKDKAVVQPVQIGQSSQTFAHKSGTLIGEDGQDAFTIRSSNPNGVKDQNYRIRRLTPIECERLQGFPDNHTKYGIYDGEVKKMSNTQRYKQCGNAVTVDVVKAVAEQLIPIYNA